MRTTAVNGNNFSKPSLGIRPAADDHGGESAAKAEGGRPLSVARFGKRMDRNPAIAAISRLPEYVCSGAAGPRHRMTDMAAQRPWDQE